MRSAISPLLEINSLLIIYSAISNRACPYSTGSEFSTFIETTLPENSDLIFLGKDFKDIEKKIQDE